MAGISKAEREARKAAADGISPEAAKDTQPQADPGLIAVTKNGETLHVHPSCLHAHKSAAWLQVESD